MIIQIAFLKRVNKRRIRILKLYSDKEKSAKAGGLSLNDIYVTMFYDWDDSLIGTLTCGVGEDATRIGK